MKTNGRLIECDRCGNTTFCKTTGDGELDGGYTRWNKFEDAEGWSHEHGIGDLCTRCTEEFRKILDDFKNAKEKFKGGAS